MRLLISESDKDEVSFDTIVMSPAEFNNVRAHLFIVSNNFDEVVVELTDKVMLGKLRPLLSRTKVIPKIVDTVNTHAVGLLCELYPDKSAELRYTFMRNPENIGSVISSMSNEFHWDDFY